MKSDNEAVIASAIESAEEIAPEANAPIKLQGRGRPQRDMLLEVCDLAQFWRSPEGETFATVPVGDHDEHYPLYSRAFRDWMLGEFARRYSRKGRPASAGESAVRDARQALEARAYVEGLQHQAPLRAVEHDGAIYLDRGTQDWSAIKITPAGWNFVARAPVPILRSKRAAALIGPSRNGDFGPLRHLLKRLDDDGFLLLVSWCLQALVPNGPYPIMIFSGEAGSGKSTLARLAQRLVDPVRGDLLQPPGDDRDLIAAARNGRVLGFDNLSKVSADLSDSFCRLTTGSEIGGRALYTDYETATFAASRPLILNGIPDLAARGDLADRSIVIRLGPLHDRSTERDWWRAIDEALPAAFGALLDALALGLNRLDGVPTPDVRMADFARLVTAAEPALPWPPGQFLWAYARNRKDAVVGLVDGDLVASRILAFAKEHQQGWAGLKSELYAELSEVVAVEAKRGGAWPGNPRWFSDRLSRAAPALRALGVSITERRVANGIDVTIGPLATPATSAAQPTGMGASNSAEPVSNVASAPNGQVSEAEGTLWRKVL